MVSTKQSPTNQTYLISITAPHAVEFTTSRITDVLERHGLTSTPLPAMIPVLETSNLPPPPVPGLLPGCFETLKPGTRMEIESEADWLLWPVDSGVWLEELAVALNFQEEPDTGLISQNYPMRRGIPLARMNENGMDIALVSAEVNSILEKPPGWRALNLVCWSVEYVTGRPWQLSAAWYPLWRRRLKRAPKSTNNNK
jgi:hypothetical protein